MTITRHDSTSPVAFDPEQALRFLGYNPEDPKAQAVVGLCIRYQLDPFANHVIVIPGRPFPYVTRDGHLHLAHVSRQLDGIEVLEEWVTDKNCHAKVAVWRKDMSRPFIYTGRAPLKDRRGGWDENADKRAVANAEVRALKRAFPLQLPSIVDYEDDLEQADPGSSRPAGAVGDAAPGSPGSGPTPGSPSTPEPEASPTEADRSGVEGSHHKNTEPERGGGPPSGAASTPPGEAADHPPGRRPPGGPQRSRSADHPRSGGRDATADRATTEAAEQAAFEQGLAGDDPGRRSR